MKPKLKPPGTKRLKLNCDILLSTSAFKFNLRRYTMDEILFEFQGSFNVVFHWSDVNIWANCRAGPDA